MDQLTVNGKRSLDLELTTKIFPEQPRVQNVLGVRDLYLGVTGEESFSSTSSNIRRG